MGCISWWFWPCTRVHIMHVFFSVESTQFHGIRWFFCTLIPWNEAPFHGNCHVFHIIKFHKIHGLFHGKHYTFMETVMWISWNTIRSFHGTCTCSKKRRCPQVGSLLWYIRCLSLENVTSLLHVLDRREHTIDFWQIRSYWQPNNLQKLKQK